MNLCKICKDNKYTPVLVRLWNGKTVVQCTKCCRVGKQCCTEKEAVEKWNQKN